MAIPCKMNQDQNSMDSFVKFSVGGSRSIYRGIPFKIEEEKIYKGFPCKSFLLEVPNQFLGEFPIKLKRKIFTKDFHVKRKLWECSVIQMKFKRKSVVFFSRWSDQLIRTHLVLHVPCFPGKKDEKKKR